MSATTIDQSTELVVDEAEQWAEPLEPATWRPSKVAVACQRGMATAEYAIGILAAICVALTLAKMLTGASFIDKLTKPITTMIGTLGTQIKAK